MIGQPLAAQSRLLTRLRRVLPRRVHISRMRLQDNIAGWLFISPVWLSVLIFKAYPLVASLQLSFREWNPMGLDKWVGWANYEGILRDTVLRTSFTNSLYFALFTVPAGLVWGIALALAVQNLRGRGLFRALYFMPSVVSSVAIAVFWSWMFNRDFGLINQFLRVLGIQGPNWLGHTSWALPSVSFVAVWMGTGYWMVIFLAAVLDIPQQYSEAAIMDGASAGQVFRHVTLPLLTPTIFYYLTNALVTLWSQFELVYVMTAGGPANATMMPALALYNEAWRHLRMGYASAIGWVIAIVIFGITTLHFGLQRKWVHYDR